MMKKLAAALPLFVLAGCSGLGDALYEAGTEHEQYKTCVLTQIEAYASNNKASDLSVEKATAYVIAECKPQEDAFLVAITDVAMTMTGNMVAREEFLENEDAKLRRDLHELAADLVADEL